MSTGGEAGLYRKISQRKKIPSHMTMKVPKQKVGTTCNEVEGMRALSRGGREM
jgi:hypothetical protein